MRFSWPGILIQGQAACHVQTAEKLGDAHDYSQVMRASAIDASKELRQRRSAFAPSELRRDSLRQTVRSLEAVDEKGLPSRNSREA